jgi:hypothetical protein
MAVPGDWNSQAAKLEFYEGTVWMRQKFNAAPKDGKRYFLYFGAVNYESHVYLNGKKLGSHKGGFTPFQFEVTGRLLKGENTVVVKADNTRHQDDIPTVNTDWWNYGGITRDVLLAETPDTYIEDYQIQLAKGDMGRIEGFVQLAGAKGKGGAQDVTIAIAEPGREDRGAHRRQWPRRRQHRTAKEQGALLVAGRSETVQRHHRRHHRYTDRPYRPAQHRDARPRHPVERQVGVPARDLAAR